jgi:anti-anti-sigma factor
VPGNETKQVPPAGCRKRAWFFDQLVKGKMQPSTHVAYNPCGPSTQEMARKADRLSGLSEAFTIEQPSPTQRSYTVRLEDWLWLPFNRRLRQIVRTLLRRGERNIVLDLTRVSKIDAAGIGELVRGYNMARASDGTLRIANANPWIREMLERVALFERLNSRQREEESSPTAKMQGRLVSRRL